MKKVISVLLISGVLIACNNSSNGENVKDSVINKIDSTKDARIDSLKDTTNKLKDKVENSFDKTDSANRAHATQDTAHKK